MSTKDYNDNIAAALFGKTRRAILSLLFTHTDEEFYLRQLLRSADVGHGSMQRELKRLYESGIILREVKGNQVYFRANPECPVFNELKSLAVKTVGIVDVLKSALDPILDKITFAFVFGSFATGSEKSSSDVDVMVVGNVKFSEVTKAFGPVQNTLNREINPTVYPPKEFKLKMRSGHHFLDRVIKESKIMIVGKEDDITGLAKKRLGKTIRDKQAGDK